jgi:hypothetical protein
MNLLKKNDRNENHELIGIWQIIYEKDDRVMIFHDPKTEVNPEGFAELVKLIRKNGAYDFWQVRFSGEDDAVLRWIRNSTMLSS